MDIDQPIAQLTQRLLRYPADRYPVQHATAQFHLGAALIGARRNSEAAKVLRASADGFASARLVVEQAKATNMLGVALRSLGLQGEASTAFTAAAAAFAAHDQQLERAAALFNLGLVHRDLGRYEDAIECFLEARQTFQEHRAGGQVAAAMRELGATQFAARELDAATPTLQEALRLAERMGDLPGLGMAANTLGLVHLAAQRNADAMEAFRRAVAAHPRSVRPSDYAMAKANLALAYEQAGSEERARLSARQAAATPSAAPPVVEQARTLLDRLDISEPAADDLLAVLEEEPREQWIATIREEIVRWADEDEPERQRDAGGWIDGQLARPSVAMDLATAWLGVLLELAPEAMGTVVRSTLAALRVRDNDARVAFRTQVKRALAMFPPPQLLRLEHTFARIARELGLDEAWQ